MGEDKKDTLEDLAKEVPEICKGEFGDTPKGERNPKLTRLRKMSVLQWLIMVAKMKGLSDRDIARKIGCSSESIGKERKKIQRGEWYESVAQDIMSLSPLFMESLRMNALNADPFVTVSYFKGTGHFSEKHKIEHQVTVDDQRDRFAKQVKEVLGIEGIDVTKAIPVDTPYGVLSESKEDKKGQDSVNDDLAG